MNQSHKDYKLPAYSSKCLAPYLDPDHKS